MQGTVNFGHFIPISTIDWYGRCVSVLFLRGCQLRCPYCQNHAYLTGRSYMKIDHVKSMIEKSVGFISALVFSGGEPTLQPEVLEELAMFARSKDLAVGIQTNGFEFETIHRMLDRELLDKVFLDIKAPLDEPLCYEKVSGMKGLEVAAVARTLKMCIFSGVELEVRTTVFQGLIGSREVLMIARYLDKFGSNGMTYAIQQGRPEHTYDLKDAGTFTRDELLDMARNIRSRNFQDIRIRTRENGDERVS